MMIPTEHRAAISRDRKVDILVVGAGPAGMFTVNRLLEHLPSTATVMLLDKGKDVSGRSITDPLSRHPAGWETHDLVSGAGGAGLYSDGKLTLTLNAGNKLGDMVSPLRGDEYLRYIEQTLVSLDGVSVVNRALGVDVANYEVSARKQGLTYKHLNIRHFGSDALANVVRRFFEKLTRAANFDAQFQRNVIGFRPLARGAEVCAMDPAGGLLRVRASNVVFAVGKEGSIWLSEQFRRLGVGSTPNRVYVGVRVEFPAASRDGGPSFDPKLSMSFGDGTKIKTHCFCRRGNVLPLRYFGFTVAGSHTPFTENQCSFSSMEPRAVYGVLLGDSPSSRITRSDIFRLMKTVDRVTSGQLLVQTLSDYRRGVATTKTSLEANRLRALCGFPGSIRELRMPLDFDTKLAVFLERMARFDPSTTVGEALIYAPAIEWWMPRIVTNSKLETALNGIYVAGDGAGVSQGITAAATAGLVVADAIAAAYTPKI